MQRQTWITLAAGLAVGAVSIAVLPAHMLFSRPATLASENGSQRWACAMMDYIGNKPGPCPVCGMTLQRVTAGELNREQQRRMGLETSRVVEGPARVTIRAYGTAAYDHRFSHLIIPRVAGRIVQRHPSTFGLEKAIDAGTPIVDLYSPDVIAAQGELIAAVRIGDTKLIAALRERFVRWNLAELADRVAQRTTIEEYVTIHTPFGGQVLLDEFEMVNAALAVGREVMPDTPLLRLVDPQRLVLVAHVPEARGNFLSVGQSVLIESDDRGPLPDLRAEIGRVSPEISPDIRAYEVQIYIANARDHLRPGSLVLARIHSVLNQNLEPADPTRPETWGHFALIPKAAVLSTGVRHVAWRLTEREANGQTHFTIAPLALGPRLEDENGNDQYVVRAGLSVGDEVATQGAFLIDSQAQLAGTPNLIFPGGAAAPAGHQH
ncbi:MAG: efflux RND transporter periplasmic adaptor subunit [Verrucomicrobia bacterium]|nr:efflux RND transporter periplasmic adaptor subunit [Verrucomicrobiota bacterium]